MDCIMKMRDGYKVKLNRFITNRFMNSIECTNTKFIGSNCIKWKHSTPYISIYKKRIHCRNFVYDYSVDDIPPDHYVIQVCECKSICVQTAHLKCINQKEMIYHRLRHCNLGKIDSEKYKSTTKVDPLSVIELAIDSSLNSGVIKSKKRYNWNHYMSKAVTPSEIEYELQTNPSESDEFYESDIERYDTEESDEQLTLLELTEEHIIKYIPLDDCDKNKSSTVDSEIDRDSVTQGFPGSDSGSVVTETDLYSNKKRKVS